MGELGGLNGLKENCFSVLAVAAGACILIAGAWVLVLFGQNYLRWQARLDSENTVQINRIMISQYEQKIQIEQQKKRIKVVEAEGIAAAQHIINKTLTNQYLQHEAIEAQKEMANGVNHTVVYIPSGNMGLPLVKAVE